MIVFIGYNMRNNSKKQVSERFHTRTNQRQSISTAISINMKLSIEENDDICPKLSAIDENASNNSYERIFSLSCDADDATRKRSSNRPQGTRFSSDIKKSKLSDRTQDVLSIYLVTDLIHQTLKNGQLGQVSIDVARAGYLLLFL